MATIRKTSAARAKTTRSGSKTAKPSRSASAASKPASKHSLPKPTAVRPAAVKPAVKPAARPVPAKPASKPAGHAVDPKAAAKTMAAVVTKPGAGIKTAAPIAKAAPAKPAVAKGSKAVAKGKVKLSDSAAKRAAQAIVRPLGVLPPESMARSTRPHPAPLVKKRPIAPVPKIHPPTSGQGVKRVTEQEQKQFEERLLEERRRILKEMGHLENTVLKVNQRDSSGDLSGYSFHMADAGTDAMEREKAFMFASTEGRTLIEINEALRRLYRGEYGVCESCSQPIAHGRLQAMPSARLCVACKEKEERTQRGAQ